MFIYPLNKVSKGEEDHAVKPQSAMGHIGHRTFQANETMSSVFARIVFKIDSFVLFSAGAG